MVLTGRGAFHLQIVSLHILKYQSALPKQYIWLMLDKFKSRVLRLHLQSLLAAVSVNTSLFFFFSFFPAFFWSGNRVLSLLTAYVNVVEFVAIGALVLLLIKPCMPVLSYVNRIIS